MAMSGKMGQRPGVQMLCPASQAGVAQRVKRERLDIAPLLSGLLIHEKSRTK
jgi:hypothetical protein